MAAIIAAAAVIGVLVLLYVLGLMPRISLFGDPLKELAARFPSL
jgi:hypothetical protein